jgi:hypothetical protein
LPTREVLQILAHGPRILVSEIVGSLVELPSDRLSQAGDPLLVLRAEMLCGPAHCLGNGPELIGEVALTLAQARRRPVASLLKSALGLVHHLILHIPDLIAGTPATLLAGLVGLRSAGFGVWHRHRIAPWLTCRPVSNQPPNLGGIERSS